MFLSTSFFAYAFDSFSIVKIYCGGMEQRYPGGVDRPWRSRSVFSAVPVSRTRRRSSSLGAGLLTPPSADLFGAGLLTTAVNIFRSRNLSEKTRFRAVFPRFLEERGRDTIHEGISLTVVRLRNIAVFPGFLAITRMFTAVVS